MVQYKNLIWTASHDWGIHIYRVTDYKRVAQLSDHGNQVTCLAVIPKRHLVASGGVDKEIRLWNTETRTNTVLFQGHTDVITNIRVSPGEDVLWSVSHDEVVRMWSLDTFQIKRRCQSHSAMIESLAVLNRPNIVFSGDKKSNIFVMDGLNGVHIECIKAGGKPVTSLLAEDDWLCGIVGDSQLVVWKMNHREKIGDPSTGGVSLVWTSPIDYFTSCCLLFLSCKHTHSCSFQSI
jgi:WD40 repeat protein